MITTYLEIVFHRLYRRLFRMQFLSQSVLDSGYLWADRYWITNDDPFARRHPIKNMNIYAHSTITIIVAGSDSPDTGLPASSTSRTHQPAIRLGDHAWTFRSSSQLHENINQSRWSKRGLEYQEGLLSRRGLIFSRSQVYFQCQCMHFMETIAVAIDAPTRTYGSTRMIKEGFLHRY